jgi:hydroxymethylpyrimidine/phosphomethylpyrimidine kinase
VFEDIFPDAVKIGMVSSSALIEVIANKLVRYKAANIVVDPVMVATSGARLIDEGAIETLKAQLLPLATVITPNIPEAEILADMAIGGEADMEAAARTLFDRYGCTALVKGYWATGRRRRPMPQGSRNCRIRGVYAGPAERGRRARGTHRPAAMLVGVCLHSAASDGGTWRRDTRLAV